MTRATTSVALREIIDRIKREGVVLATGNPHKVEEMRALLGQVGIQVHSLSELRDPSGRVVPTSEPKETGATFEANASIKALEYARQSGRVCLADDSGLEIDALGGAPGVISSHYSSDGRDEGLAREARDAANNERVLRELASVPEASRTARFVCVMAVATSERVAFTVRGTFEGRIGMPGSAPLGVPRGRHGFGYDPLFLVAPDYTRTSAELSAAEKNAISHRARALSAVLAALRGEPPA